jgi:hypothetical protein
VSLNYLRVSDFTLSPAASSTRTSELPKEMENIREQTFRIGLTSRQTTRPFTRVSLMLIKIYS